MLGAWVIWAALVPVQEWCERRVNYLPWPSDGIIVVRLVVSPFDGVLALSQLNKLRLWQCDWEHVANVS